MSSDVIDFEAIRLANPLPDFCARHGIQLRRSGQNLVGKCPLHNEQNGAAFVVFTDHVKWRCFGKCDRGGDVLDLDVALHGGTTADAAKRLGGVPVLPSAPISRETTRKELYKLIDKDCDLMARASVTLRRNPELALRVRSGLNLEAVEYVALDGDLGFVADLEFGTQRGPVLIFGYSHGLKARWPGKVIRWLCGSAADRCWRDSLLIPSHKRVYLTEGEIDAYLGRIWH